MKKIRIAAIQMCSKQDRNRNLESALKLMKQAVTDGAELIALPENFSFIGSESEKIKMGEDYNNGPSVNFLKKFATEHGVALVGGSIPLKTSSKSKVTNTCIVFDSRGRAVGRYDKLHLFDVSLNYENTFSESKYIKRGNDAVTVQLFGHIMGLSICYDLRFPELYRALALRGAEILFVPSAFTLYTGKDHWESLLRARAIENQSYVVAPAQYGKHSSSRISYGRTMIIDPWGQILSQCQDKEDLTTCDIDFDFLDDIRKRLPCLDHIRREMFVSPQKG
jgi:deaminated glutathione amidase